MDAKTSPSPHGLHSDARSGPSNVPGPGPTQGHRPMRSLDRVGQEPARFRCPRDTPYPPPMPQKSHITDSNVFYWIYK